MIGKVSGLWFPLAYFGFFYHIIREQIGPKVSQIDSVKPCVSVRLTEWNKFFCLYRLHLWVQAPRPLQFQQLVRICQEWTLVVTTLMHPSHNHFWYESVWSGRVSANMRIEKNSNSRSFPASHNHFLICAWIAFRPGFFPFEGLWLTLEKLKKWEGWEQIKYQIPIGKPCMAISSLLP